MWVAEATLREASGDAESLVLSIVIRMLFIILPNFYNEINYIPILDQ